MAGDIDRFNAEEYADDEPVHVFRTDQYGPENDGLWIPERIWHRLRSLGAAYELHLLPLLDGTTDPVFMNATQVKQLISELAFVSGLVRDPLVEDQVQALISLSRKRSHGASKDMLGTVLVFTPRCAHLSWSHRVHLGLLPSSWPRLARRRVAADGVDVLRADMQPPSSALHKSSHPARAARVELIRPRQPSHRLRSMVRLPPRSFAPQGSNRSSRSSGTMSPRRGPEVP